MDEKKYRGGAHAAGKRVSPKKEKPQKAAESGEPKPKRKGLGALCAAGILLALVIGFCGFTAYQLYFNDTIRKGVFLGEADLSGKTVQEARAALEDGAAFRGTGSSIRRTSSGRTVIFIRPA